MLRPLSFSGFRHLKQKNPWQSVVPGRGLVKRKRSLSPITLIRRTVDRTEFRQESGTRLLPILFYVLLIVCCLLAGPSCFSWHYPATKHCGYFICESLVAKRKIPIGGPTNLVNNTRFHLMTEKFSVRSLPFFIGSARTQIDRMVAQ